MSHDKAAAAKGFHHVALKVRDFDASHRFYTAGIGLAPARSWKSGQNRAMMLDTGDGSYLEVFEGGAAITAQASAILHFAFRVTDCDASIERARKAGAVVTVEPKNVDIPADPVYPVRIAFCTGPDGETIEFFQER